MKKLKGIEPINRYSFAQIIAVESLGVAPIRAGYRIVTCLFNFLVRIKRSHRSDYDQISNTFSEYYLKKKPLSVCLIFVKINVPGSKEGTFVTNGSPQGPRSIRFDSKVPF